MYIADIANGDRVGDPFFSCFPLQIAKSPEVLRTDHSLH